MALVATKGQDAGTFAVSRIARIAPLYWLITTFILALKIFYPTLTESAPSVDQYLKSILFIPYFRETGALVPMVPHGWTLNYEMFFYLCVFITIIFSRRFYVVAPVLLISASYLVLGHLSESKLASEFYGSTLLFEFVFGMLLFSLFQSKWTKFILELPRYLLISIAVMCYFFMATTEALQIAGLVSLDVDGVLLWGLPSLLLVASVLGLEGRLGADSNIILKSVLHLGDASYATYLSHPFVIYVSTKFISTKLNQLALHGSADVILTITTALLAGSVLYILIDRPLSKLVKAKLTKYLLRPS